MNCEGQGRKTLGGIQMLAAGLSEGATYLVTGLGAGSEVTLLGSDMVRVAKKSIRWWVYRLDALAEVGRTRL